jgi:hypothetical protein
MVYLSGASTLRFQNPIGKLGAAWERRRPACSVFSYELKQQAGRLRSHAALGSLFSPKK